jgi:hypothetical protein
MLDVVLFDAIGMPLDLSTPMGGSEMQLVLLAGALRDAGLTVEVARIDRTMQTRALLVQRYSPLPRHVETKRVVVMAHDMPDERYEQHLGREVVCVSDYQREAFEAQGYGACRVIRPVLGDHVSDHVKVLDRAPMPDRWIYPTAANKGLEATLRAWAERPRPGELVVTWAYGADAPELDDVKGVRWLGKRSPLELVGEMAKSEGLFYRNTAPECFPMTVAIARALGLTLDVECVGHARCGVQEALLGNDLSAKTIAAQWIDLLFGGLSWRMFFSQTGKPS